MVTNIISNVSVDCVIFGFDVQKKSLNVLLKERCLKLDSFSVDDYVLTGYHILINETLDEAAIRILEELIGVDGLEGIGELYKKQFKVFGDPDRLTKAKKDIVWIESEKFNPRTLTVAYYFLLKTEEVNMENNVYNSKWFPMDQLPELGFDHKDIILDAYEDLKVKSLYEPIIFELLPNKFTINDLQELYESVLDIEIDNRNFRRKVINKKYMVALDEKQVGVSKKPAQLYMFSKDIYQKMNKKTSLINI